MAEVRDAVPEDAYAIATVHVASWRVAYRGLLPDAVLDGLSVPDRARIWAERLAALPPRCAGLLVVDGPTVLGFTFSGPARDDDDPAAAELYAIYLDPDSWGRGHGSLLHAGTLDRLHAGGFTHACLWVLEANERALRFYHRHGWAASGETKVRRDLGGGVGLRERRLHRSTLPG